MGSKIRRKPGFWLAPGMRMIGPFALAAILFLLASCAPAAQAPPQQAVKTAQVEETKTEVQKEVVSTRVLLPSATAASTPAEGGPTPLPTQLIPTPTVLVEARLVELEWPSRMRLGDSDVIRLSLVPSQEGYVVKTEFPGHETDLQQVPVKRPSGYDLVAIARLDGVKFDISPGGEQERLVPEGEVVTWRWSLSPRQPGQQRLTLSLVLRWTPQPGASGAARESVAYSRGLDVGVTSFFGMTRGQAMAGGLLGLFLGSGIILVGLVSSKRPSLPVLNTPAPNPALKIEPRPGLQLSSQETPLLQALFRRYARLALESEFLSGYSGARTFLARPIRSDGRADAYTIVKIGACGDIRREFVNYETFVKDTLPPVTARIQQPPVTSGRPRKNARSGDVQAGLAALQYTFIAEPGRTPTSLRQHLLAAPDPSRLWKLFDTFGPNWWMQRRPYTFRLAQEYDRILPTHLVVNPCSGHGIILDGETPPAGLDLEPGSLVTLRRFPHVERRADGRSLSLRGVGIQGQPPLRVRWLGLAAPEGKTGQVVATRWTLLRDWTREFDLLGLPDPLDRLPSLLGETVTGTQSTIHGDLNLENVLVGPGDFVWLIDFAQTREGHPLYDFAHLYAEIVAHVLAPQITSPADFLVLLQHPTASPYADLYALLSALDDIAHGCLFNPSQPKEWQLVKLAACLGALKFANLSLHARHMLFLTAAWGNQAV